MSGSARPEEFAGLGFAPGSVKGVRSFRIDKYGRLTGVVYPQVWRPGENVAECRAYDGFQIVATTAGGYSISGSMYARGGVVSGTTGLWSALVQPPVPPKSTSSSSGDSFSGRGRRKPSSLPAAKTPSADKPERPKGQAPKVEDTYPPKHPFESCTCGFYGYFDGSDDYHDHAMVTGVVEAYGEAVIGTRGFRAMKARIIALRVKPGVDEISEAQARKVRTNYAGVPMFDSFERMVAEFPADSHLEPSPETDPDFWTRD